MAAVKDPLGDLLKAAEKKYNLTVGSMNAVAENTRAVTTGNLAIDYAIGVGGIPLGRSVELFGEPSCGKTTTALQYIIAVQKIIKAGGDPALGIKADDRIIYFDYEQAMDKTYAAALGLDLDHESLLFTQPDTLEDGADFCLAAIKTGRVRVVVFDSVAAMNPSAQAEADSVGKSLPAIQAKIMKPFGVNLNVLLRNHNATAIFLNHSMEKMSMGGRPGMPPVTTTPGGSALKYFASVRIEYKPMKRNKGKIIDPLTREEQEIPTSTDVRVKIIKNKVAPPFREAVVRVRYGRGFDNFWTSLQVLIANKYISYQAGRYYFHKAEDALGGGKGAPEWMPREKTGTNRPYVHGEAKLFEHGDSEPEWRNALIGLAEKIAAENAQALAGVAVLGSPEEDEQDVDPEAEEVLAAAGSRRISFDVPDDL